LIWNGSFEQGSADWELGNSDGATIIAGGANGSAHALRIDANGSWRSARQVVQGIRGRTTYAAAVWTASNAIIAEGPYRPQMGIFWRGASGDRIGQPVYLYSAQGTESWHRLSTNTDSPDGAVSVEIVLYTWDSVLSGQVSFDAVSFVESRTASDAGLNNADIPDGGLNRDLPDGDVAIWTRWEALLTSSKSYTNPYADVTVSVTYTGPNGEQFTAPGFWDGERAFRLRFMFPEVGTWSWRTTCSDASNVGLHDRTGVVTVASYSGSNPLYKNGYLRVSTDQRYLTSANGTPFLWLGDTAWSAPVAATQEEWERYIQKRKAQKFNVIQVHSVDGWIKRKVDRGGNAPFQGSGSGLRWNPAYWRGVEEKVQYANDQGLLVFLAAVRMAAPDSNWGDAFPEEDSVQVRRFVRNLAARLMGNFVVYSPVADDFWTRLADEAGSELQASTPVHLVTTHPEMAPATAAYTFHDKSYVDFAGLQSGGGWSSNPHGDSPDQWKLPGGGGDASQYAIQWTLGLYHRAPRKPVIDLEVMYDSLNLGAFKRIPRSTAYLSLLSGAKGVTYGCDGVWNWGVDLSGIGSSWDFATALDQASATEMEYLFDFFSSFEWWRLIPSHELVQNQSSDWLKKMAFAKDSDGRFGVAYLPDNPNIVLDMRAFAGSMTGRWFNPVTSKSQPLLAPVDNVGTHTFSKPAGWEDAVLFLSSR
jgi:hypothetical protein